MKLLELKGKKLRPLKDLVAFVWLKPKLKSKLIIPDTYYDKSLKVGKFFIGEIIAIGPEVKELKPKDKILVQEYARKDSRETWREDEIYFTEEKNCKAKVSGVPGFVQRIVSKKEKEAMLNA